MRLIPYIFASLIFSVPALNFAHAQATDCAVTGISSEDAPPPLPDYDQPPLPGPGYVWTPGYWAYNNVDYYWVPGTWVEPPQIGYLWTPPYWGFANGAYVFHRGYWGQRVGFYGGIDYGYGYAGHGSEGGRWDNGQFFYNRAVTNVTDTRVTNVYDKTVVINENSRISYNGGRGGLTVRPTAEEEVAAREPHMPATRLQTEHLRAASVNGAGFASLNHGRPAIAATARPGEFRGPGVLPARTGHHMEEGGAPAAIRTPAGAPEAPTHGGAVESHMDRHNGAAGAQHEAVTPGHEGHLHQRAPGAMHENVPAGRANGEPMTHAAGIHETAHRPNAMTMHGGEMHAAPHGEPGMHGSAMHGGAMEMHAAPRRAPEMHGGGGMQGGEMHGGAMRAAPGGAHGGHPAGGRRPDEKR
jgi:hypothetical protein